MGQDSQPPRRGSNGSPKKPGVLKEERGAWSAQSSAQPPFLLEIERITKSTSKVAIISYRLSRGAMYIKCHRYHYYHYHYYHYHYYHYYYYYHYYHYYYYYYYFYY